MRVKSRGEGNRDMEKGRLRETEGPERLRVRRGEEIWRKGEREIEGEKKRRWGERKRRR